MRPFDYAARIVYGSRETLQLTYDLAIQYKDHPGVYCEMGVAAGAHIIVFAEANPNKKVYAFDSHQGIPWPSNRDNQMPGIRNLTEAEQMALPNPGEQILESSGATVVSEDNFWKNITDSGVNKSNIVSVPGWFEETVPKFASDNPDFKISILRLDSDLYNSTFVCLIHLFPRLIDGGVLLIDDINLKGCADAVREYFELISYQPNFIYKAGVAYLYK